MRVKSVASVRVCALKKEKRIRDAVVKFHNDLTRMISSSCFSFEDRASSLSRVLHTQSESVSHVTRACFDGRSLKFRTIFSEESIDLFDGAACEIFHRRNLAGPVPVNLTGGRQITPRPIDR